MNNGEEKTSLIPAEKQSILEKVKRFFEKLFSTEKTLDYNVNTQPENKTVSYNKTQTFLETIRTIEDEETKLLKLQKQYRSGKIRESDMTKEQINKLCDLYDRQIETLQKSNAVRKEKLLLYRKRMKQA